MPTEISVFQGSNLTIGGFPDQVWGWSTAGQTAYSGSTSANGASTHSTMSYYVQPFPMDMAVVASKIQFIGSYNTGAAGTGSATVRNYIGLYAISSDSLTLVSSWMGGFAISQNSATAYSLKAFTGSDPTASIQSGGNNSSAAFTGGKIAVVAQGGLSTVGPGNFFAVYAMHSQSVGANPFAASIAVQANTYNEMGVATNSTRMWVPLNGAFSSTSSTNAANSNQWLMPPSVATNAITATRSQEQLRFPLMFRSL